MNLYFLDGVGAGFLLLLFALGLAFLFIAILLEAFIIQRMQLESQFKKALLASLVANLVSLAAGFLLSGIDPETFVLDNMTGFAILFGVTVLTESLILYLLHRSKPFLSSVKVSLLMNTCTYLIAFILIKGLN